jgi:hypothetical protein
MFTRTLNPMTPPDPIARSLANTVGTYNIMIQTAVRDMRVGLAAAERILDHLPDALTAVESNPLSADALEQLRSFATQLDSIAGTMRDHAMHSEQAGRSGRQQLERYEARLAELRRLDAGDIPDDAETVWAEDAA